MRILATTALAFAMPIAANAVSVELIENGGFESGLTGWSCVDADRCNPSPGFSGDGIFGFDNSGYATLSQSVGTVIGETYDFSFYARVTQPEAAGNILGYSLDGGARVDIANSSSWMLFEDSFVASGATALIAIFFETDSGTGTWYIDEVSVMGPAAVSAVPVPASIGFALSGLAALGLVRRRRRAI